MFYFKYVSASFKAGSARTVHELSSMAKNSILKVNDIFRV